MLLKGIHETIQTREIMLHKIDCRMHTILSMLRKKSIKNTKEVVDSSLWAWNFNADSEEFVDQLRKSSRLDWVR